MEFVDVGDDVSEQDKRNWRKIVETARANWVLVLASVSLVTAFLGWIIYGVSPLQPIAEIGYQQKQQRLKEELVNRHLSLGNDFLNVGQLEAAKAEFSRAQELDSYNVEAQFGLLKASAFEPILSRGYDPEIAERRLRLILEARPNDSHVLCFMGDVLRNIDPDSALACYDRAIATDSANAWAFLGKGLLLDEYEKAEQALVMYQQASLISPWNQTFLNNLGYQYFLRQEYTTAESIYVRLLRLDSRYLLSYYMLAHAQLLMGYEVTARNNLSLLWQLISDTSIVNLPQNSGAWFFHFGGARPVYIYTFAEKKAYAHYITALAEKLLSNEPEVRRHIGETNRIKGLDKGPIEIILRTDIERIQTAHPKWRNKLDQFRSMILDGGR